MSVKRILLVILLAMGVVWLLAAQPVIKAELDAGEYNQGDLVKVRIILENNPGVHNIAFDLAYDGNVLAFEELRKGSVVYSAGSSSELLYADNSPLSGFTTARMVVSFSLLGADRQTLANGLIAECLFRITGTDAEPHTFRFASGRVLDKNKQPVSGVSWQESGVFSIVTAVTNSFILIRQPYENQVFYTEEAGVSLICTEGNYLVRLTNSNAGGFDSGYLPVQDGRLLGYAVPLGSAVNRIKAELYQPDPVGGANPIFLAEHSIRVYRSAETDYITITEPANHSLLNTDMVDVRVLSSLDYVEVNGLTALFHGEREGASKVYKARVWLKKGFNTITAVATKNAPENILYRNAACDTLGAAWLTDNTASWTMNAFAGMYLEVDGRFARVSSNTATQLILEESTNAIGLTGSGYAYKIRSTKENEELANIRFKDAVQVYYRKDSSLFRFVQPLANQGFKPSAYTRLAIKGEIDSLYKTAADPATGGPVANTVTLKVTFYPHNTLLPERVLADNKEATLAEAAYSALAAGSRYIFYNNFSIPLDINLGDGIIEITAYKNKKGSTWDDKITRVVYVDNRRLWIDLVQPNVFTSDLLDSALKIRNYNETQPINNPGGALMVTNEGEIRLAPQEAAGEVQNVSGFTALAEAPDGTLYGLVNASSSLIRLYRKTPGQVNWNLVLSRAGMYGYSLCYTQIGLLVGVSNIPSNGNSGLYLLSGDKLVNFGFPGATIAHAQFLVHQAGRVYIYGSLFSHLYSFSVRSVEEAGGKYVPAELEKTAFPNTYDIKQFVPAEGAGSILLCTTRAGGNVRFFRKGAAGYAEVILPALDGSTTLQGDAVIYGAYTGSEYNAYTVLTGNTTAQVIMENRNTGKLFRREINLATALNVEYDTLLGCGFHDNQFYFILKKDTAGSGNYVYPVTRGKLLFDQFIPDASWTVEDYTCTGAVDKAREAVFITESGSLYLGTGSPGTDKALYQFYRKFADTGSCSFNYVNEDIEGITGFSFGVDPAWLLTGGYIDFGFDVRTKAGTVTESSDQVLFGLPQSGLSALIKLVDAPAGEAGFSDPHFTLTHHYDTNSKQEVIHVEFRELQAGKYLHFALHLHSQGQASPGIANLEVFKKIRARITNAAGSTLVLPIQGYIYDSTVTEVTVQHDKVKVGKNGYFSYNYEITNAQNTIPVLISCKNAIDEQAELNFTVEIIASRSKLWDVQYAFDGTPQSLVPAPGSNDFTLATTKRTLVLSGKYYGLAGAVLGYKLFSTQAGNDTVPLKQGLLATETVSGVEAFAGIDLGPGYEAGTFTNQVLTLFPNEQRLVLYIENPGSSCYEYTSAEGWYPVFNYTMPPEEQEILFHADLAENATVDGIPIAKRIVLAAYEETSPPYTFTCRETLTGEVRSLEKFDELLVRSYTPGLVFSNGTSEQIIPVQAGNRFAIPVVITMGSALSADFDLAVIPTIPVYNYLCKGIRITVKKHLSDTTFIPDFSAVHPEQWTEEQRNTLRNIPIRFTFKNRKDVPVPDLTRATLTVNFATTVTGFVDVLDSTYYCLKEEATGLILDLEGINRGKNRIQWSFEYVEKLDETHTNTYLMSSSCSGKPGCEDDIFLFEDDGEVEPTVVTFKPALTGIYYNNNEATEAGLHLPDLTITRDVATTITLTLNGKVILENAEQTTLITYQLPAAVIKEGRNSLRITAKDKYGSSEEFPYTFLYDSAAPVAGLAGVEMNSSYTALTYLAVSVREANFHRGYLYYGGNIINAEPEVRLQGADTCLLVWSNLESFALNPAQETVSVKAVDLAGHTGSAAADPFTAEQRPGETTVKEQRINLPQYDGVPLPVHETNYPNRPFPAHTKFAPGKLLEKVSVKEALEDEGNCVLSNFEMQKIAAGDGGAADYFGKGVAVSGDYAVIGAPRDDDKGLSSGSAYVFEKQGENWIQVQKLTASDGAADDYFGHSVAVSGNYMVIGAYNDDDKGANSGSAYVFEKLELNWVQVQKLTASDGAAEDNFGRSVAVSGSDIVIGAYNDDDKGLSSGSAYVFEKLELNWVQVQKLTANDGSEADNFGYSTAISDDYLIIGAHRDNDMGYGSGSAYVFEKQGASWMQVQKLTASDGAADDRFGYAVAVSENHIVIGAYGDDDKGDLSGSAYVFEKQGVSWVPVQKLTASDGVADDKLGHTVAVSENYVVIGVNNSGISNSTSCNSAYVFEKQGGSWVQLKELIAGLGYPNAAGFSASLSVSGSNIVIGKFNDRGNESQSGAAYIYNINAIGKSYSSSFLDSYQKKYLVFQFAKNPYYEQELLNVVDLAGKIQFEVYGYAQTAADLAAILKVPATGNEIFLNLNSCERYVEGLQYLYYIVDIAELKSAFTTALSRVIFQPEDLIVNRGILQVVYDSTLQNFSPYDVYVTGENAQTPDIPVSSFTDILPYDNTYRGQVAAGYIEPVPELKHPLNTRTVALSADTPAMSLTFWLRLEGEGISNAQQPSLCKPIVSFCDENGVVLYRLGFRGKYLDLIDVTRSNYSLLEGSPLPLNLGLNEDNLTQFNAWNLITLRISPDLETMEIMVYDPVTGVTSSQPVTIAENYLTALLTQGASFYFGAAEPDFNTGFYSVANPFYINRLLTNAEIVRLQNLYDRNAGGDRSYTFPDAGSHYGTSHFDLHSLGGNDAFCNTQNADYTEPASCGSLKASAKHDNLFKTVADGEGGNYVILRDADTCIPYNLSPAGGSDSFTLTLSPGAESGRYYFGDKNSNYGLKQDRWYSVTGRVESIGAETKAWLVLKINGREQRRQLTGGRFHFIYDNSAQPAPAEVKLYIESNGNISLGNDLVFSEGNYSLPSVGGLKATAATTTFTFDVAGSIGLWYKPFITNSRGFLNYPVCILDSEYIKIGAEIPEGESEAVFYAQVKADSSGTVWKNLATGIKADYSWQHLQVAYDKTCEVVYFYINGKVAAFSENSILPVFGSLEGNMPQKDNVFLGCNSRQTLYAEGYLDNINLSKYYSYAQYRDNTPVAIAYNEETQQVTLDYPEINPGDVTELRYTVSSMDGTYRTTGAVFPVETGKLPAGRYQAAVTLLVNGHRYDRMLTFNVDDKPRFNLAEHTPFLFAREETALAFSFEYDRSYQYQTTALKYAGVGLCLEYNSGTTEKAFLVQDFINQDSTAWLLGRVDKNGEWKGWSPLVPENSGRLKVTFPGIIAATKITCGYEYFYFTNTFPGPSYFTDPEQAHYADGNAADNAIPLATLAEPETVNTTFINAEGNPEPYQYMLTAGIAGEFQAAPALFAGVTVEYTAVNSANPALVHTGETGLTVHLPDTGLKARLYYDDMLGDDYGIYSCTLRLKYRNITYATRQVELAWRKRESAQADVERVLEIEEFSLLQLDTGANTAGFYLQYSSKGNGLIACNLEIKQAAEVFYSRTGITLSNLDTAFSFENVPVPQDAFTVRITVTADGFIRSARLPLDNRKEVPAIVLTNSVDAYIPYNDVSFSWKGYNQGKYLEAIAYTYNFDNTGWSTPNNQWRSVRFYNLEDGYHTFIVKAVNEGKESVPVQNSFFVDIHKPVFNGELITVKKLYHSSGIFYAVQITGKEGAVSDASLTALTADSGAKVVFEKNGSFRIDSIPVTVDGVSTIVLTALDRVGNYTDYTINIENNLTEILYPAPGQVVQYSPLALVGKINAGLTVPCALYVRDPFCTASTDGSYAGWKKARINPDRTFFVEDLFVNPGSREQSILTTLEMACVFPTGKNTSQVFTRQVPVLANTILLPIELSLDTHAVEGENGDTEVEIKAHANVDRISSWSIDFDGDGIYDEITLTDNPYSAEARTYKRIHRYSALGLVKPRVRVITVDGAFFSVTDTLIIHEKIKAASHKMIDNPLSVAAVKMPDNSTRLFILKQTTGSYAIDVFEIGRNETYISNRLYSINLGLLGITSGAFRVKALDDNHLLLAVNGAANGSLFQLTANAFGNYEITNQIIVNGVIREMALDAYHLFVSFTNRNYFVKIAHNGTELESGSPEEVVPQMENTQALGINCGLSRDADGLLAADFYNQRIVRLTTGLAMHEQFGSIGTGEKEFLTPALIKALENRIFVYDRTRRDIQVFDLGFTPVCTLTYNPAAGAYNYLEADFFNAITDLEIITRTEGNRMYYYGVLLSASMNKCALLRLPQWEELRARVRNNKITFLKEGEVFTAKPDGSDLRRVLSTDSLPRIDGNLDYPALSPDARRLVFTSRLDLYIGDAGSLENTGNLYAYNHIYLYDMETGSLRQIRLHSLQGYEIERPVFNSNGNRLIFSACAAGGKWQLYTFDFDQADAVQVLATDENTRFPCYSPDDRFIAFTTDYDGDEDVMIMDTQNTNIRVAVTNNHSRDSLPVWVYTYPGEISNPDLKIESKIAYVSERDYHKGVYAVYLSRPSESDVRVVTQAGAETGSDPDAVAREIPLAAAEGDYPCFTGDGTALVLEQFDGIKQTLQQYDFTEELPAARLTILEALGSARRPAGMKNMITHFTAENVNGDEIALGWKRYTDNDIFYTVQFRPDSPGVPYTEKRVFSQTSTLLKGLEMGQEYLVRVCIVENSETVAASQWKEVQIPVVAAKPTFHIDEENPYLVHLHAWKPVAAQDWKFAWIIDNNEILVQESTDYAYEFATSGRKTILLKAYTSNYTVVRISEPVAIEIKSDIDPFIEYVLAEDSGYIELSCAHSAGNKINFSSAAWTLTGPGAQMLQFTGPSVIAQLNGFTRKLNVSLTLQRIPVNGQQATDTVVKTKVIDLDLKALKPLITYAADAVNPRLIKFSGRNSLGNIDWYRAHWVLYADNALLYQADGVSSFDYLFPERNAAAVYTVSLTIPRRNDGVTETVSQFVSVEAAPIEAKIKYEILTLQQAGNVIGRKLFFHCTESRGSDIDFTQARWSVPVAGEYGEQAVQVGPTATYNLVGIEEHTVVEVALTLCRRGGIDPVTITRLVPLSADGTSAGKLVINPAIEDSGTGKVLILDVFKSTGPNIDWERTEWLIDGQYTRKGPAVRYDIAASAEASTVTYTCILYRYGGQPQTTTDQVNIKAVNITPVISYEVLSADHPNLYKMHIFDTIGINIDWDRTRWYIYDGSQDVTIKQGAEITHAFAIQEKKMGYPVMVQIFLKGDARASVGYTSIDVKGDTFVPLAVPAIDAADPRAITFSATTSTGSNIDWSQTKWTFLDTAETAYGPVVTHKFPAAAAKTTQGNTYTYNLTLFRKLSNGQLESKTAQFTVDIAGDEITPVVSARVSGEYLVLSVEKSGGKGLLLDRAVWSFHEKGDSSSSSVEYQTGTQVTGTFNTGGSVSAKAGVKDENVWSSPFYYDVYAEGHVGYNFTSVDYSSDINTYRNLNDSFSTSNSLVGPVCRRDIAGKTSITVTLFIYRMTNDGGTAGKSKTVTINIATVKAAGTAGVEL